MSEALAQKNSSPHRSTAWRSKLGFQIPKGLCPPAQGCEGRATLGRCPEISQPRWGCAAAVPTDHNPDGVAGVWRWFSQGSSFLATLGFAAESLWDSSRTSIHRNTFHS
jgi:hypothetical protein